MAMDWRRMPDWKRMREYFRKVIWETRARDLPMARRIPVTILKLSILTFRGFRKGHTDLRANALTLNTLLAIVPVLALLFGIAKGFGLERNFRAWLLEQFPQQQEVLARSLEFAQRTLDNTQGGLVAGAGVVFLLYTVVQVIGQVELAMNQIWSINRPRNLGRKFSDYLSLILVGPFLLLGASSLNVYISTWVNAAAEASPLAPVIGPAARTMIRTLPFLILWLLFSFTYIFLPNTKVKIASGLLGGAAAALLYQVAQSLYIQLQVGVSRTNAIYGSFAALPLFIIWLRISWNIVLFGAELTQQHQNFASHETVEHNENLSFRETKRIALAVRAMVLERFARGESPATAASMADALQLPVRALAGVLVKLTASGVLVEIETAGPEGESGYLPARAAELLTPEAIVEALENLGEELPPPPLGVGQAGSGSAGSVGT